MKSHRNLLPLCAAMAAIGATASQPAAALMITQPAQSFDAGDTLTFDFFNSAGSTLNKVEFIIDSDWTTFLDVDYSGPEGSGGSITGTSSHTAKFASDASIADMGSYDLGSLMAGCTTDEDGAFPFPEDVGEPDGAPFVCDENDNGAGSIDGNVSSIFPIVFDPDDYVGAGTFNVTLAQTGAVESCTSTISVGPLPPSPGPPPECSAGTSWSGSLSVKYTFDVPEPTTLVLFGLGLAGLGVSHRRKREGP